MTSKLVRYYYSLSVPDAVIIGALTAVAVQLITVSTKQAELTLHTENPTNSDIDLILLQLLKVRTCHPALHDKLVLSLLTYRKHFSTDRFAEITSASQLNLHEVYYSFAHHVHVNMPLYGKFVQKWYLLIVDAIHSENAKISQ